MVHESDRDRETVILAETINVIPTEVHEYIFHWITLSTAIRLIHFNMTTFSLCISMGIVQESCFCHFKTWVCVQYSLNQKQKVVFRFETEKSTPFFFPSSILPFHSIRFDFVECEFVVVVVVVAFEQDLYLIKLLFILLHLRSVVTTTKCQFVLASTVNFQY